MPVASLAFNVADTAKSIRAAWAKLAPLFDPSTDAQWELDLSQCGYLGPYAAVLIRAAWESGSRFGPQRRLLLPSRPPALAGFCRYSGLTQLVGGPPPDPNHPENETVPLWVHRQATFLDAKPILDLVARHVEGPSPDEEFQDDVRTCVTETIQNVVDHAASPIGGISCARFNQGRVAVAVADLGVGIAASLRRRFSDISDELDAMGRIAQAEGGRGLSALSRESNAGLGLHWLRTIVERRRGSLSLMSGNAFANVASGSSGWSIERMAPRFGGTAVFFSLPAHES